jgi:hypothetical protein
MSFHKQDFSARLGTMGDVAEAVFDQVYPKSHKLGLNRPPFSMAGMALALRYTPDRMLRDGFWEVMGCGKDRLLKLKVEKLDALFMWSVLAPVNLFVYDQKAHEFYDAPMLDWFAAAKVHGEPNVFENDGKEFYALHVEHFPCVGKAVPGG